MCPENNSVRRATVVGKLLAILVGLIGLYIISAVLWSVVRAIYKNETFLNLLIVFPALTALLGGYCIYVAVQAWLNMSARIVRRICLITTLLLCSTLLAMLLRIKDGLSEFQELTWMMLMSTLAIIIGGVFYFLCSRVLIKWLALTDTVNSKRGEKVFQHFFGYLVALLWAAGSLLVLGSPSRDQGRTPLVSIEGWSAILIFVLLILAFVFYRIVVCLVRRKVKRNA